MPYNRSTEHIGPSSTDKEQGWEAILTEEVYAHLYRFALRKTKNKTDAADLTHKAILKLINGGKDNASRIDNIQAYLRTVASNLWKDSLRSQKKIQVLSYDEDQVRNELERTTLSIDPTELIHDRIDRDELISRLPLNTILGQMTDEERHLINLRVEGRSFQEIAEAMNRDVSAVRYLYYRFLARIRYRTKTLINEKRKSA